MRAAKVFLVVLGLAISVGINSCKCNGDYNLVFENFLHFSIIDRESGENLLHIQNNSYNYDTLAILDSNSEEVFFNDFYTDGSAYFSFLDPDVDRGMVDEMIIKRFYVYFNYEDSDTIDIAYEMAYDDCDFQRMKYLKVSYNDSLYFDGYTDYVPYQNFLK